MKFLKTTLTALLCNVAINVQAEPAPTVCARAEGITLQVLGSGGPIADDGRASSGYLVWFDGKSRFLVDAGGLGGMTLDALSRLFRHCRGNGRLGKDGRSGGEQQK